VWGLKKLVLFFKAVFLFFCVMSNNVIISKPEGVCLAGNLPKLVLSLSSEGSVQVRLSRLSESAEDGVSEVLIDETYTPDFSNQITVDFRDFVWHSLSDTVASPVVGEQDFPVGLFEIYLFGSDASFSDISGVYRFYAVRGGVQYLATPASTFLARHFLSWQPSLKEVSYDQPEYLSFYTGEECVLKISGGNDTTDFYSLPDRAPAPRRILTLDMSLLSIVQAFLFFPKWVEVRVEGPDSVAFVQRYNYVPVLEGEEFFLFENSLGGLDSIRCTGSVEHAPEYSPQTALIVDVEQAFRVDKKDVFRQNTGWLSRSQSVWLQDMFSSLRHYHYYHRRFRRVLIEEITAEWTSDESLTFYEFSYRPVSGSLFLPEPPADSVPVRYMGVYHDYLCQQGLDPDAEYLYARYLLDGDLQDSSGHGRDASSLSLYGFVFDSQLNRQVLDCNTLTVDGQPVITPVIMDNTWSHWRIKFKMYRTGTRPNCNPLVKGNDYGDNGFKVEAMFLDTDAIYKWAFGYYNGTIIPNANMVLLSPQPVVGQWYDVELYYSPSERGVGVDGNFSVAANSGSSQNYTNQTSYNLLIGAPKVSSVRRFDGYISDVRIYKS
jgi:hypothetical protein